MCIFYGVFQDIANGLEYLGLIGYNLLISDLGIDMEVELY